MKKEFDPAWMIDVIEKAEESDSFLRDNPKLVSFLLRSLPDCKLEETIIDPLDPRHIKLWFIPDRSLVVKASTEVHGAEADLSIDITMDDRIGFIEIWFKTSPSLS